MLNFFAYKMGIIIVPTLQVYHELCWYTVYNPQIPAIIKQYHQMLKDFHTNSLVGIILAFSLFEICL